MWKAVVVVVSAVTTLVVLRRAAGAWLRRRGVRRLPADRVIHLDRGVPLRAFVQGPAGLSRLDPTRTHRTRADLAVTADRFVLSTERGVLADVRAGDAGFTSVRSTGPGRLVIEGTRTARSGAVGMYRFELVVDDAGRWVQALSGFVSPR